MYILCRVMVEIEFIVLVVGAGCHVRSTQFLIERLIQLC